MAKMKYWNGELWETLDAKDADTLDGKHAETALTTTEKNDLAGAINEVKRSVDVHKADGAQHAKTARFVIGTSTAGWTLENCDYLCDGTNDQEEIIQALNDLPETGGEVVILDGIYNIKASINILKDNVSIRGNGNATILKRKYDSTNTDSGHTAKGLITLNGKSGCKIQGLQIDGNKSEHTSEYNCGIYLSSSSNNTVTSNTCNDNNSNGIYLSSSSNNTVTGNTCNNNDSGIYLSSSSYNTVTGNTCNNNNYDGIRLQSSSNNTITGNTCYNNSSGIDIHSSSNNNTITSNTCNNDDFGIHLDSSSNNTITGNTCYNNSYNGIHLYSSSNNTVTGNTYNDNNNGICLSSSSNNNTITSNTCNNNDSNGIFLYSSSNDNTITSNTCNNNNNGDGIYLYSSSNNTITSNTCNNNYDGIRLQSSSNNTITGNTCIRGTGQPSDYASSQYTIRLSGSDNSYNLISSNNCMGKNVVIEGGTSNTSVNNKYN